METPTVPNPQTFVKDSVITTKIKSKLAAEHPASAKHIKVDTDENGVVWLSGTTDTQVEADKAVEIARNTEGVKSVNAKLTGPERPLTESQRPVPDARSCRHDLRVWSFRHFMIEIRP